MNICGLQKVSLLDYPGLICCTIFTRGCNFCCPYCQNSGLVIPSKYDPLLDENKVLEFLKSRIGKLDAVTISGGEPTLQKDLESFIRKIKDMGYLVKLDTNGYNPDILKDLVNKKLIDYVAMDIKNSPSKYPLTASVNNLDISRIKQSIDFLINGNLDYEFRTTLIKQYHNLDDVKDISLFIKGAKKYYLQNFKDSEGVIKKGLNGFTDLEIELFKKEFIKHGTLCLIRGKD